MNDVLYTAKLQRLAEVRRTSGPSRGSPMVFSNQTLHLPAKSIQQLQLVNILQYLQSTAPSDQEDLKALEKAKMRDRKRAGVGILSPRKYCAFKDSTIRTQFERIQLPPKGLGWWECSEEEFSEDEDGPGRGSTKHIETHKQVSRCKHKGKSTKKNLKSHACEGDDIGLVHQVVTAARRLSPWKMIATVWIPSSTHQLLRTWRATVERGCDSHVLGPANFLCVCVCVCFVLEKKRKHTKIWQVDKRSSVKQISNLDFTSWCASSIELLCIKFRTNFRSLPLAVCLAIEAPCVQRLSTEPLWISWVYQAVKYRTMRHLAMVQRKNYNTADKKESASA